LTLHYESDSDQIPVSDTLRVAAYARALDLGFCPVCAAVGQTIPVVEGRDVCRTHLRGHRAPAGEPGIPATPRPPAKVRPGRKRIRPLKGLRRAFLRRRATRKVPRATGSRRRLSPDRMEDAAALLVVQAITAKEMPRVIGWTSLVLYALDAQRPAGAKRSDSRTNLARIAVLLAVSADWRSGRRARPGRQVSAGVIGLSERTITRHWAILVKMGLIILEDEGRPLSSEMRDQAIEDMTLDPDQRARWYNRAEWRLAMPAWVREVTADALWPYIGRAVALVVEAASPAVSPVDNRGRVVVDKLPGLGVADQTVTPSFGCRVISTVPVDRSTFSYRPPVDNRPPDRKDSRRPGAKEQTGASRSPAKSRPGKAGRRMPIEVVRLARQAVADKRLSFMAGAEVQMICGTLHRFAMAGWTIEDVVAEARKRLADCKMTMLAETDAPARYLKWLLKHAVLSEPPAQIDAAAAETERLVREAHTQTWRSHMGTDRVPESAAVGGRAARALVEQLAAKRRTAKIDQDREYVRVEAMRRAVQWPEVARPADAG
jgi:DNA-binding transcriptional ArsR family regulator